jgi:hypothetical protein
MNEVDISQLFIDLSEHLEGTEPAGEELVDAINAIIRKYKLHASVVISLLARLTAGYIRVTQEYYNKANASVVVEQDFQNMLEATLTSIDVNDINEELEKMNRLDYN